MGRVLQGTGGGGGAGAARPASISPLDYQMAGAHGQQAHAYPKLERAASSAPAFGAQDGPGGGYELQRASSGVHGYHDGAGPAQKNARGEGRRPSGGSSSAAHGFDCYNGKVMTGFTVKGAGSGDSAHAKTGLGAGSAKDLFGRVQTY